MLQLKSPYKDGTTYIAMEPLEFMEHTERATDPATDHAQGQGETPRMSWDRLLKRVVVVDIDIEHCPNCGGALKIIAAIEDPPVIIQILSHLGLPTRAPPQASAQRFDLFQTI